MAKKLNIEELFKSKLENLEQTPSSAAWNKISRQLRWKQFLRFNPRRFNVYYGIGALLIATGLAIAFIDMPSGVSNEEALGVRHEAEGMETRVDNQKDANDEPVNQTSPDSQAAQKNNIQPGRSEIALSRKSDTDDTDGQPEAEIGSQKSEVGKVDKEPVAEQVKAEPVETLIAYFTPSVTEGCPPLHVRFVSNSVNASDIFWMVNGEQLEATSTTHDLNYTFNDQGTYVVTMTAISEQGLEKTYSETINVYPKPTAEFEIVDNEVYNYSLNATAFEWKLLPGEDKKSIANSKQISNDFQPDIETTLHLTPNAQSLALIAKNNQGCADTTLMALPEASAPELTFPSAFNPNPNGSTGGYYNPLEPTNKVFHPRYNEEPATFTMQIFNKQGEIIFKTNNIQIGWDGYHKEAPAAQGVYIFQATGTWKNGKPFNYRGDITILWNNN